MIECWRVYLSNGSNFTATSYGGGQWFEGADYSNTPVAGDFNGDNKDDIAYRGRCGNSATECWRVHLSNGANFTATNISGNVYGYGWRSMEYGTLINVDG